ncbi:MULTISPECIES: DUF2254 family protein [unclassified Rathayibacter]|uniref:DUF2254 family protein n=1 Tax=unclassified Rathayibacter TaxID=2609250 RepID=UPI0006FDC26F|nr:MULTISPECIES: DUF2254 family protein [unclassified Rathayibacter]KQQ06273.1 hypothetical protein ASF42_07115 [Rathayibacter sp. Leaf294]KQS14128.1 hypothetical protein ASG06_07115 [Rathayibacter sp. Leaf185]
MARGSGRRRGGGLEDDILRASTRGPGARTRAEVTPPSGRHLVLPPQSGTVLAVDVDALIGLAARADLMIALERRPGDFAVAATPLLSWWSSIETIPSEEEERRLDAEALAAVTLGPGPAADVDSQLRALVEGGDLDALASALALLARVPDPPAAFQDPDGFLRVMTAESSFERRLAAVPVEALPVERTLLLLRDCAFTATLPRRRAAVAEACARVLAGAPESSARVGELADAVDAALERRWSAV